MGQVKIKLPKAATCARHGLSLNDFRNQLKVQGGVCGICHKVPPSGKLMIDHEHVAGWKKLSLLQRRRYVRGLLCSFCNRNVARRTMTLRKTEQLLQYLYNYEGKSKRNTT